jgi:hypothetical protein
VGTDPRLLAEVGDLAVIFLYNQVRLISFAGMTLTELLPSLQQLSTQEKIKAIQFLATELDKNDSPGERALRQGDPSIIEEGTELEVWSPYDAFSAEKVLTDMLSQHLKQN